MIKIRLQRRGRKKRPIHHIVVADSRAPRDGRIVEDLGRFNNLRHINEVKLNEDRAIYWMQQGAQLSDTVRSIFKKQGILYRMHLVRWGKSDEEIEAALAEWREKREAEVEKEPSRKERQQAMLEAEEKEYQKQLKKKAEEAAKEKAKREALAEAKEEEETQAAAEEETSEEAEETEAAQETEETPEAENEQEEVEEQEPEAETESADVDDTETEEAEEEQPEEESVDEPEEEETQDESEEETSTETEEKDEEVEAETSELSTDMLAKEAIEHIENTSLKDLKGFVPENEDRVTVQRAWESKQKS